MKAFTDLKTKIKQVNFKQIAGAANPGGPGTNLDSDGNAPTSQKATASTQQSNER